MGHDHVRTLGAICLVMVALAGCGRSGDGKPSAGKPKLTASVGFGLGDFIDTERWNVLIVTSTNPGEDFDGHLEVRGLRVGTGASSDLVRDPVRYRVPVAIPQGEKRRIEVPVYPADWFAVRVRFEQRGYESEIDIPLSASGRARCSIPVISGSGATFSPVRSWTEDRFRELERAVRGKDVEITDDLVSCRIATTDSTTLPDISMSYSPFQLVILHDT
jgi:hypothetical protein